MKKLYSMFWSVGHVTTLHKKEVITRSECKKRLEHFAFLAMMEDIDDRFPYGGKVK